MSWPYSFDVLRARRGWLALACAAAAAIGCALPEATKIDSNGAGGSAAGGSAAGGSAAGGSAAGGSGGTTAVGGNGGAGACASTRGPEMVEVPALIGTFCIDSTEVTRGQYLAFVQDTDGNPPAQLAQCASNADFLPGAAGFPGPTDNHPITAVDWCDAHAFCAWAGKRLCGGFGGGSAPYSIGQEPTAEDQHYFACTKGVLQAYPYGNSYQPNACNGMDFGAGQPIEVASLNGCEGGYPGVFDMYGNVVEWLDACESDDAGANCVARGGSFIDGPVQCGGQFAAQRFQTGQNLGIRCCRDL